MSSRGEWYVKDAFGDEWRITLVTAPERRNEDGWRACAQLELLIAQGFAHWGASDDGIASVILEVYDALTNDTLSSRLSRPTHDPDNLLRDMDHELRRELVAALMADEIRIEALVRAPWPFLDGHALEERTALVPEAEPTAWIAIELLDDDGNPVPNASYRIECDNGWVRTGTTDASGKAREDGLHEGNCNVSFPGLHGPDWRKVG